MVEAFILNNRMSWFAEAGVRTPGFRSEDIAERFDCCPSYVRYVRRELRKAGKIPQGRDA